MKLKHISILIVLALILTLGAAQAETFVDSYARAVVSEVNRDRAAQGLGALRMEADACRAGARPGDRPEIQPHPTGRQFLAHGFLCGLR